jgi:hypothetical protein
MDCRLAGGLDGSPEVHAMFEIFCPTHSSRVLLDSSRIERFRNTSAGPVVDWRCWCGTRGSLARGGPGHADGHRHAGVAA